MDVAGIQRRFSGGNAGKICWTPGTKFLIPRAQEIYFVWEYFGEPNTFWWVGQMLFCGANTFGGENTFGGSITE